MDQSRDHYPNTPEGKKTLEMFESAFSPEKVAQVDDALERGVISSDIFPSHVKQVLKQEGSRYFSRYGEEEEAEEEELPQEMPLEAPVQRSEEVSPTEVGQPTASPQPAPTLIPGAQDYGFASEENITAEDYNIEVPKLDVADMATSPASTGPRLLKGLFFSAYASGNSIFDESRVAREVGELDTRLAREYEESKASLARKTISDLNNQNLQDMAVSGADTADVLEIAEVTRLSNEEIDAANPSQLFMNIVAPGDADEGVKVNRAAQMEVGQLGLELADSVGWLDYAMSIGGSLFPLVDTTKQYQESGSIWESDKWAKDLHQRLYSGNAQVSAAAVQDLRDQVSEMDPIRAMSLIDYLSMPASMDDVPLEWSWLSPIIDIVDIGTAGAGLLYTAIKRSKKLADPVRAARDAGETKQAGEAVAEAVITSEASGDVIDEGYGKWARGPQRDPVTIDGEYYTEIPESRRIGGPEVLRLEGPEGQTVIPEPQETLLLPAPSPEVKAVAGNKVTLTNTAQPFKTESFDGNSVDGISAATIRAIDEFEAKAKQFAEDVTGGKVIPIEGYVSDTQARLIHDDLLAKYQARSGVDNVEVSQLGSSFVINFDKIDEAGNVIENAQEVYDATLDSLGSFVMKDYSVLDRWVYSPLAAWRDTDLYESTKVAERLDGYQAKLFNELRSLEREALKPILGPGGWGALNPSVRNRLQAVSHILQRGNLNKEVYTPSQLTSGELGVQFDDAMVQAYYNTRSLMDTLYMVRNNTKRRELQLQGFRHVDVPDKDQLEAAIGQPYNDVVGAKAAVREVGARMLFVPEINRNMRFDEFNIDRAYQEGKVLVRFQQPTEFANTGNKVHFAIVPADNVKDLPERVLNYTPGYIPQISKNAVYFVKERRGTAVDGVHHSATSASAEAVTVREFDNKAEAEAWAFNQNRILAENGIPVEKSNFIALEDSQLEKERAASGMGEAFGGTGGLYTGKRSDTEILFGAKGEPREFVPAFEAISRNIASLSKYASRNEWRLGMERQAVETANRLIGKGSESFKFSSFEDLKNAPNTDQGRVIKQMYVQIRDWTGMPTSTELAMQDGWRRMIDSSFGKKMPGAKKGLMSLRQNDTIGLARAATFHSLLGWFNLRQLWVQAQGAAVAASMHIDNPLRAARVAMDMSMLGIAGVTKDSKYLNHVYKSLIKANRSVNPDQRVDVPRTRLLVDAWNRSGIADSILTNADHAAAAEGHGIAMDALSRAADKGLMFYRGGELINRSASFSTAFDEWYTAAKKTGKPVVMTDRELGRIIDRTNDLMLNMSKANRAPWQRGALALRGQFLQINQKALETITGATGSLSRWERAKVLIGQAGLYGMAGVPLSSYMAYTIMGLLGVDQSDIESLPPEMMRMINDGAVGLAFSLAFDIDVDVSEDSALLGGLGDMVNDMFFEESSYAEKFFGAFGGIQSGFAEDVVGIPKKLALGVVNSDPMWVLSAAIDPVLNRISSWNNVQKAMFMHDMNRIVNAQGSPVVVRDFSVAEEIAKAIGGFDPSDVSALHSVRRANQARQSYLDQVAEDITDLYYQFARKSVNRELTESDIESYQRSKDMYMSLLANPYERQLVTERVKNNLTKVDTIQRQTWDQYRKLHAEGVYSGVRDSVRALQGNWGVISSHLQQGSIPRQGILDQQGE